MDVATLFPCHFLHCLWHHVVFGKPLHFIRPAYTGNISISLIKTKFPGRMQLIVTKVNIMGVAQRLGMTYALKLSIIESTKLTLTILAD